jgi:hypothetical protein
MLLVLTSAVFVNSDYTKLRDKNEREKQYVDSFMFYIKKTNFTDIVICDGSNFDFSTYNLAEIGKNNNKTIEVLFFESNKAETKLKGKGFGEGEILRYVLSNSELLKRNKSFFKITGRIKVSNINSIIRSIKKNKIYFRQERKYGLFLIDRVDTRIYYTKKDVFESTLLNTHHSVSDKENYFLENCYYDNIKKAKIRASVFKHFPIIRGISGSSNIKYDLPNYKLILYQVLNFFEYWFQSFRSKL